jgi:hypothetical protein
MNQEERWSHMEDAAADAAKLGDYQFAAELRRSIAFEKDPTTNPFPPGEDHPSNRPATTPVTFVGTHGVYSGPKARTHTLDLNTMKGSPFA